MPLSRGQGAISPPTLRTALCAGATLALVTLSLAQPAAASETAAAVFGIGPRLPGFAGGVESSRALRGPAFVMRGFDPRAYASRAALADGVIAGSGSAMIPADHRRSRVGRRPIAGDPAGTGIDPSLASPPPQRSAAVVLQRVRHPTSDEIRWADTAASIGQTTDLGARRLLVRLDRFGRKADYEMTAALGSAAELVLDLRRNRGGLLGRMLEVAARFTGPVPEAVRLIRDGEVRALAIPAPRAPAWRGPITVLVGAGTISSGEVLAALLRRHAGARVLGDRTWGKDYVLRIEPVDHDWRALVPDGRIEVPGEVLAGGLVPDGPIPAEFAASIR